MNCVYNALEEIMRVHKPYHYMRSRNHDIKQSHRARKYHRYIEWQCHDLAPTMLRGETSLQGGV